MSAHMDWQQKFAALNALAECSLKMRAPGDWYVYQNTEVKETQRSHILIGRYGNGDTPVAAIEDHWRRLTEEEPLECVVIDAGGPFRRQVRWNGFMWAEVRS